MGKKSRKINKKLKKKAGRKLAMENAALKKDLEEKLASENYAEVINDLAQLIENKCYDEDIMYYGAYSYFMLGDYERAIAWVNNTLSFAPHNLKARILLARICFIEDKSKEGLDVIEFVLKNYKNTLSEDELTELKNIASFYVHNDEELIKNSYADIAALFNLAADAPAVKAIDSAPKTENAASFDAEIEKILAEPTGIADKVKILNAFAGGMLINDDYAQAEKFLAAALKLDLASDETLANLAILTALKGDKDKALAFAGKMSYTSFALLTQLKNI